MCADSLTMVSLELEPSMTSGVSNRMGSRLEMKHNENESNLVSLTDAFVAYSNDEYMDSIVPANVAVESALLRLLSAFLRRYVGNERVDIFLNSSATYSDQLNLILPLVCSLKGLPILSTEIRGLLNSLRRYRNNMAHRGIVENPLAKEQIADMLCAAIFGYGYISLIESELQKDA